MDKTTFGILTIILNAYGVPNFIAGDVTNGVLKIVLSWVTFGVIGIINLVKGIIQGINILKMSDEEYAAAELKSLVVGIPSAK